MTEKYIILLLQLVKTNGSVSSLLDLGLEYSQIATYINFLAENDLVTSNDAGKLEITKLGLEKLKKLTKIENHNLWISPQNEFKIEKRNKFDIYLPKSIK
ncbi:winged helix-turn-helix domain-containing protein [Bacillus proteolyticus]|uniref:winged helix-turn-helix domain-containing protein n=1 Tax=Bacillus proteolyticus TaxID=2026192 RepID=UPI0030F4ADCF